MNGITEIRMRKIQSRTRKYRRRYEWREITCLTVCSLFLLAGIGILLGHIQNRGYLLWQKATARFCCETEQICM